MTRDDLIEKVALKITERRGWDEPDNQLFAETNLIADTIFAALKEPTEEMTVNGYVHCYKPLSTWQAMLNASPLAPKE